MAGHFRPHRHCWSLLVLLLGLLQKEQKVTGQSIPSFQSCREFRPEDTPIGDTLFTLRATVKSGSFPAVNLTLTAEGESTTALVNVTQARHLGNNVWGSDVILIAELDLDFEIGDRQLNFKATDTTGNQADGQCSLFIQDVNDCDPAFQGLPFDLQVPEDTPVGSVLLRRLSATDRDTVEGQVELSTQFPDKAVERMFIINKDQDGTLEVMNVTLAKPLDYESRNFYSFQVTATDGGGRNTSAAVTVRVIDVQDTPPFFLMDTYRAVIKENEPAGTPVVRVSAEDGDLNDTNDITYSIVSGGEDYFAVDNVTGEIRSLAVLDRDNSTAAGQDGVFQLVVRATETDTVEPQYGNTTRDVTVMIMVDDVNDEAPKFDRDTSPYIAFVREDAPVNSLLYFDSDGYIVVSDSDQGRNSHFRLTVERDGVPWPGLEASPSLVFSEGLVLLKVNGTGVFDGLAGTDLSLQLVAQEVYTAEAWSSTASVVIAVRAAALPPPAPQPTLDDSLTAPDVFVFVIGLLVVFNVAATVLLVWLVRRGLSGVTSQRQGLVRHGSKYYVNGNNKDPRLNGAALALRSPDSVMVEVEGRDRCDVVPLSAVLASRAPPVQRESSPAADSPPGARVDAARAQGCEDGLNDSQVSLSSSLDQHTDRKTLLGSQASPARAQRGAATNAAFEAESATSRSSLAATDNDPLPDFSMARKHVSSPNNPALSYRGAGSNDARGFAASYTFRLASTTFPSTPDVNHPVSTSTTTSTTKSTPVLSTITAAETSSSTTITNPTSNSSTPSGNIPTSATTTTKQTPSSSALKAATSSTKSTRSPPPPSNAKPSTTTATTHNSTVSPPSPDTKDQVSATTKANLNSSTHNGSISTTSIKSPPSPLTTSAKSTASVTSKISPDSSALGLNISALTQSSNNSAANESPDISAKTQSTNISDTTQSPNFSTTTQSPDISATTQSPDISAAKTKNTNISATTQSANIFTTTQSPNISTTTQSSNISDTTQSPNISTTTQSPNISTTTQSPNISDTTQSPNISTTTQSPEISATTQPEQTPVPPFSASPGDGVAVEPVTRFCAKGSVSTTLAAIPTIALASSLALPAHATIAVPRTGTGRDVSGNKHSANMVEKERDSSTLEMLY